MSEKLYGRILVALDGSELAERVLSHVEQLAQKFQSEVILLRVTTSADVAMVASSSLLGGMGSPTMIADITTVIEREQSDAAAYLGAVEQRLRRRGISTRSLVVQGKPGPVIVELARQLRIDLIAMTSHGRGSLHRLLMGSVADEVQRTAPCPVLQIRVNGNINNINNINDDNDRDNDNDNNNNGDEDGARKLWPVDGDTGFRLLDERLTVAS